MTTDLAALQARVRSLTASVDQARAHKVALTRDQQQVEAFATELERLAVTARSVGRAPAAAFGHMRTAGPFTDMIEANARRAGGKVSVAADTIATAARASRADVERLVREVKAADDKLARVEYELAQTKRALSMAGG
ncbi:MAG: hypothetical protein ACR2H3_14305 [Acidimicrobiales bacterium]